MSETEHATHGNKGKKLSVFLDRIEHHWIEIVAAALMALATVLSAFSAYESAVWNGYEAKHYSGSNQEMIDSSRLADRALQEMNVDVQVLSNYENALAAGDAQLANTYRSKGFSPTLEKAVSAWEAAEAAGQSVARNPFKMPQYKLKETIESDTLRVLARRDSIKAEDATRHSNNYLLLTVLFASVLFFAGIATKFKWMGAKIALLAFGALIFVSATVILALQP